MVADGQAIFLHAEAGAVTLVAECSADTTYRYVGQAPRSEQLRGDGSSISATLVGTWTAAPIAAGAPSGGCEQVTHVVDAIATGAFTASSRSSTTTRAQVDLGGVVGGGSTSSSRASDSSGGDSSACAAATAGSPRPPLRCNAFIRLTLRAIAPR